MQRVDMTEPASGPAAPETGSAGLSRRRFLGFLLAAPTLVAAADLRGGWWSATPAAATDAPPVPSQQTDAYDLSDFLTDAARPTAHMIAVTVNADGTASFDLPRAEVGQGITTAIAMLIAEEMGLPLAKVRVTLADARPELRWNQLTGGSNTIHAMYEPVRAAAATAREQLKAAAARRWGVSPSTLSVRDGVVHGPGRSATFGSLATAAAVPQTTPVLVELKPESEFTLVGTPQSRVDAMAAVTGRKVFTMDIDPPGAKRAMVCRPPTIGGTVQSVPQEALDQVKAMPGISDLAVIPTGVAVVGETFGQCVDGINALHGHVKWGPGPLAGKSDHDVLEALKQAEIPLPPPSGEGDVLEEQFTFYFRSGSPLETNCAIADVRSERAEIWASLKTPIVAAQEIGEALGLADDKVTVHVTEGGGSFGRHLFFDAAMEAALVSRAVGQPVKLLWHRTDDFRHGRMHPMATSRVRVSYSGDQVLSFQQHHTSAETDFRHGLGEIMSAHHSQLPYANRTQWSQGVFHLTVRCPYNFGVVRHELNEIDVGAPSSSVRNIYNPDVATARELMVDQLAKAMGKDPYELRRQFLKEPGARAVLEQAAAAGSWGRAMAPGTAQGIAVHREYKGHSACLVEIDCRPETVGRKVDDAWTGPRVTKMLIAVDVGFPVNPRGIEAQMIGGMMDGIGQALTFSQHLKDGLPLEGSWDNGFYTRQWNVPPEVKVIVMPPSSGDPGGVGEFAVPVSMAAVACAYSRAVGALPTSFPVKHNLDLGFTPFPTSPPLPTPKSKRQG